MNLNEAKKLLAENGYICEEYRDYRLKSRVKEILANKYGLTTTQIILATIDEDDMFAEAAREGIWPDNVAEAIYKKYKDTH